MGTVCGKVQKSDNMSPGDRDRVIGGQKSGDRQKLNLLLNNSHKINSLNREEAGAQFFNLANYIKNPRSKSDPNFTKFKLYFKKLANYINSKGWKFNNEERKNLYNAPFYHKTPEEPNMRNKDSGPNMDDIQVSQFNVEVYKDPNPNMEIDDIFNSVIC